VSHIRLGSLNNWSHGRAPSLLRESHLAAQAASAAAQASAAVEQTASVAHHDVVLKHALAAERRQHEAHTRQVQMELALAAARCDALEVRLETHHPHSFPSRLETPNLSASGGDGAPEEDDKKKIGLAVP
jgi:hypothetical protein